MMPTAQHWSALAHVEPSRTSSAPVPGTVATYQPDVAASAVCVDTTPVPPSSAVTMKTTVESAAARRRMCRMRGEKYLLHSITPSLHAALSRRRMAARMPDRADQVCEGLLGAGTAR